MSYAQFGERYRYIPTNKRWRRYQKIEPKVTRLFVAYPGTEFFYLRMLLQHRRGMRSVDELLLGPEGNMKYPNYKMACYAHDLITESKEYFIVNSQKMDY